MKIFLDTADINEIRTVARWGVLDGVTTNPTLYAKVGGSYDDILREVCSITSGPVSDIGTLTTMFGAIFAKWRPSSSIVSTSSATTSAETGPDVI